MLRAAIHRPGLAALVAAAALLMACSGPAGSSGGTTPVATATATATRADGTDSVPAETVPAETSPTETTPVDAPQPPVLVPVPVPGSPLVVLNPGHNGGNSSRPDLINAQVPAGNGATKACDTAGTTGVDGYPEHAFTFDVATRVAKLLTARGVRVELTRTDDKGVGPCVDTRAALGNGPDVAAVVSIYADGAPDSGHGFHISQASIPPAGPQMAAESDRLTTLVHDAMAAESGLTTSTYLGSNGYYPRSDLAGLSLAQRPATFLECGNMKNPGDAALLSAADGRAQIATAIAAGIIAYLAS